MKRLATVIILMLCGPVFLSFKADAATIYVDPAVSGPGTGTEADPYKLLSTAYTAASSGDTISLMEGDYSNTTQGSDWNIQLSGDKSLTYTTYNGVSSVTLNCDRWTGYGGCIAAIATTTGKTVRFENITFICHEDADDWFIYVVADFDSDLYFYNCTFDTASGSDVPLVISTVGSGAPVRNITFDHCTYTTAATANPIRPYWFRTVKFDNCNLTNNYNTVYGTSALFYLAYDLENFIIRDCNITTKGSLIFQHQTLPPAVQLLEFSGNNVTISNHTTNVYCVDLWYGTYNMLAVHDNTVTGTSGASTGIFFVVTGPAISPKSIYIADNTMTDSALSYYGVFVSLGAATEAAVIIGNKIVGTQVGVSLYGKCHIVKDNIIKAIDPIRIFGSLSPVITNNTLISVAANGYGSRAIIFSRAEISDESTGGTFTSSGYYKTTPAWNLSAVTADRTMIAIRTATTKALAFTHYGEVNGFSDAADDVNVIRWIKCSDGTTETPIGGYVKLIRYPIGGAVYNNILDCTDATYVFTFDYDPLDFRTYINYNCYYYDGSLTCFSLLGNAGGGLGISQANLTAMRAKWLTWSTLYPYNDSDSIAINPQFVDAANDDFRLIYGSPCINTGKPTIPAGFSTIGSWGPNGYPDTTILGDLNGDNKVDFADFAIFSESWLDGI